MTLDNCETAQLGRRERMGESNEIAAHSIKVGVERRDGKREEIESGQCHRHKTDGKLKLGRFFLFLKVREEVCA